MSRNIALKIHHKSLLPACHCVMAGPILCLIYTTAGEGVIKPQTAHERQLRRLWHRSGKTVTCVAEVKWQA